MSFFSDLSDHELISLIESVTLTPITDSLTRKHVKILYRTFGDAKEFIVSNDKLSELLKCKITRTKVTTSDLERVNILSKRIDTYYNGDDPGKRQLHSTLARLPTINNCDAITDEEAPEALPVEQTAWKELPRISIYSDLVILAKKEFKELDSQLCGLDYIHDDTAKFILNIYKQKFLVFHRLNEEEETHIQYHIIKRAAL